MVPPTSVSSTVTTVRQFINPGLNFFPSKNVYLRGYEANWQFVFDRIFVYEKKLGGNKNRMGKKTNNI